VTNDYSPQWYEIFLESMPAETTRDEVAFVERQMPLDAFPALLDLCCGPGRHASLLAERGYRILGVDVNERALRDARAACPSGEFAVCDMRSLGALHRTFDGVVNLWHSFGYFDDATNVEVLRQVHAVLRPGGRAIFDVYNREHFAARPREDTSERGGHRIHTKRSWDGLRHRVALDYDGSRGDEFEWCLYTPAEFRERCASVGLQTLRESAWFDEAKAPSAEHARMQLVVERAV
jgi:SAM-dependent methyltransferase